MPSGSAATQSARAIPFVNPASWSRGPLPTWSEQRTYFAGGARFVTGQLHDVVDVGAHLLVIHFFRNVVVRNVEVIKRHQNPEQKHYAFGVFIGVVVHQP